MCSCTYAMYVNALLLASILYVHVCVCKYMYLLFIFTRRMYNIVEASGSIYACRDMLVTK